MTGRRIISGSAAAFVVAVAACNSSDSSAPPAQEVFVANLSGANEVPTRSTTATGTARIVINADHTITYDLTTNGITTAITGAHIHGPMLRPDTTAGIIVPLATPPVTGQVITAASNFGAGFTIDSLIALIRAGKTYVNVHSQQFLAGEIRGTLVKQ